MTTLAGSVIGVFWRKITRGDFFNIERSREAGPRTGGGQLYIDIPLGNTITLEEFGMFFGFHPLDPDDTNWEPLHLTVATASMPVVQAPLSLTPRRGNNRRYRIANQNRQASNGQRHPAWSIERGFPEAPDDITGPEDPRMPKIDHLKVFIAKTDIGQLVAGFTDTGITPAAWPQDIGLEVLTLRNDEAASDGIIYLPASARIPASSLLSIQESHSESNWRAFSPYRQLARVVRRSIHSNRHGGVLESRRISDPNSPRPDPPEAIRFETPRASEAEDWVEKQLHELFGQSCVDRIGHTSLETVPLNDGHLPGSDFIVRDQGLDSCKRFVEVKSTSNSMPSSIHLTAAEFRRARQCAEDGSTYEIWIVIFVGAEVNVVTVKNFEEQAASIEIGDLVSLHLQLSTD